MLPFVQNKLITFELIPLKAIQVLKGCLHKHEIFHAGSCSKGRASIC